MKLQVDQALLRTALRRASIGGGQSSILGYVRGVARPKKGSEPGRLVLSASNGLIEIELPTAAAVERPGEFVAHCKALSLGVGGMPPGLLTLAVEPGRGDSGARVAVTGSSGRRWSIAVSTMELPPIHEPEGEHIVMPVDTLRRLLAPVRFGTSLMSSAFPEKDGVRIEVRGSEAAAVTFPGHVMLSSAAPLAAPDWQATIPTPILDAVSDILDEATEEKVESVSIYADTQRIYFTGPSTLLSMTLPAGEYPVWRTHLDSTDRNPAIATLPRLAVISSLRALESSIYDAKEPPAIITIGKDSLHVFSRGDNTKFEDDVPLTDSRVEHEVKFMASTAYLLGILNSLDEDPKVAMDDTGKLLVFRTTTGTRSALALMDLSRAPQP